MKDLCETRWSGSSSSFPSCFIRKSSPDGFESKVMRDVENVQALLNQMVRTLFFFILDVIIASAVTLYHSPLVFVVFLAAIPVAVAGNLLFQEANFRA